MERMRYLILLALFILVFNSPLVVAQQSKKSILTQELGLKSFVNAISYKPLNHTIDQRTTNQWAHIIKSCKRVVDPSIKER